MAGLNTLKSVRLLLYLCVFVFSIVIFGVTDSTLTAGGSCSLDKGGSMATCNWAIASGIIAWVASAAALVFLALSVFGMLEQLTRPVELFVNGFLVVWYLIMAIVFSARAGAKSASVNAVLGLSWVAFFFEIILLGAAYMDRDDVVREPSQPRSYP